MDKNAAAEYLGVTPRTLERYVKDKKISVVYVGDRPTFTEEELDKFKQEKNELTYRPAAIKKLDGGEEIIPLSEVVSAAIAPYYQVAVLRQKNVISLKEAAIISGFSINFIRIQIKLGNLKAKKIGRKLMVRPADLDNLTDAIFNAEEKAIAQGDE